MLTVLWEFVPKLARYRLEVGFMSQWPVPAGANVFNIKANIAANSHSTVSQRTHLKPPTWGRRRGPEQRMLL